MKEVKVEKITVTKVRDGAWAVVSSAEPGVTYEVLQSADKKSLTCNCLAGIGGKFCKHVKSVMEAEEINEVGRVADTSTKKKDPSRTKLGYVFGEVTSAMHKEIRRGNEEMALWWALELYETSPTYFWKRIVTQASEDIGLGDLTAVQQVIALADGWLFCKRYSWSVDPQPVVAAVLILCRATKSTEVDDAKNLILERRGNSGIPQIPDYALDVHTARGREMGRGGPHWYAERNKTIKSNPYREQLMAENPLLLVEPDKMFDVPGEDNGR